MAKEMIVSVNGREKKIAIIDNGRVTEFYIERGEENSGVAGNVYKGRVMRVLPGMQSAFVDIGLERDAFLYVSDFFDEEEEIERIVAEKSKKGTPEEAKREANEHIDRSRIEREKQMESVQELTEPISVDPERDPIEITEAPNFTEESVENIEDEKPAKRSRRGRGRGSKDREQNVESTDAAEIPPVEIDFDNSGFERISDGESEEAPPVIAEPEFEVVKVGSFDFDAMVEEVSTEAIGFERIADEDDAPAAPKKRSRAKAKTEDEGEEKAPAKKKPAAKRPASKGKFAKPKAKKATKGDELEDAEAGHKETESLDEMAVRRGGRGRRRAKPKVDENGDPILDGDDSQDNFDEVDGNVASVEASESSSDDRDENSSDEASTEPANESAGEPSRESSTEDAPRENTADENRNRDGRDRDRNRRGGRGRNDRNDRPSGDRPSGDRSNNERSSSDRPSNDRQSNDRPSGDRGGRNDRNDRGPRAPQPLIADLLKEGQEILVQIAKEPIAKKGARITSHIALPGRYLVYMPTIEHLGVSRKIESANERGRLRTLIQRIRQDKDIPSGGFIVRTAGIGVPEEDLRNDAKYLAKMWAESKKNSEKKRSPALVHQDLDLVQRILRDQLADDFTAIRVDSEEEYLRTVEFINLIQPRMVNRIKLYTRDTPILEYYGVQEEIDKALKPRVWLKSGGYLVINQTEALVAIDVNTGKFVGKGNARLEDTITRTNMEAVDEIARQIRLRDLGGIIVLDLIDMEDRRNRHKVSQALQEALASDRSPNKVLSFNDFGLIIMTRKRVKQSLERTMCAPCEYCEGSGWVKSPTTVCYEILAEARRLSKSVEDVHHTTLRVHPEVAQAMRTTEREVLEEIEAHIGHVDITSDKHVHQMQFDFAFV